LGNETVAKMAGQMDIQSVADLEQKKAALMVESSAG
jgi:hypothetical protein